MTTVNTAYLLIRDPAQPVSVRCFAMPSGRNITNSQVTAEQTAAIIEREVGRLLQLALAAAQIPGVTPASGSVYAQAAPSAAANASAVRTELATELGRIDATVSSRLASAGYTAPDNAGVSAIKAKTDNLPATPANEATVASRLSAAAYVAPDNAGIAALPTLAEIEASSVLAKDASISTLPTAGETAAASAQAVWQHVIEAGLSAEAMQRILLAALAGKTAGVGTETETYLGQDGIAPRVVASFDASNNRTSVVLDGDS